MTTIRLVSVLCACGWSGSIPVRAGCPGCKANHYRRLNGKRLDVLLAIHRGEQPVMPPNLRIWLMRESLIRLSGPAPKPRAERVKARFQRKLYELTEAGRRAVAAYEKVLM